MTPEQLAKLPKYARDHIAMLEMHLRESRGRYALIAEGDTAVEVGNYVDGLVHRPDDTLVRFHVEDGNYVDVRYVSPRESARGRAEVLIMASGRHSQPLRIYPTASNLIQVFPEPYPWPKEMVQ